MEAHPADEIKRLQRCNNDLLSVLALPAIWSGGDPSQIVHTLLDALLGILGLAAGTAISLYAYFTVIRLMYDRHAPRPQEVVASRAPLAYVSVAICLAFIVVMTFYPYTPSNVLPMVK